MNRGRVNYSHYTLLLKAEQWDLSTQIAQRPASRDGRGHLAAGAVKSCRSMRVCEVAEPSPCRLHCRAGVPIHSIVL